MNPLSDLERLVAAIEHQGANIAPTYQEYMPIAFATANDCGEAGRTFFHRICRLSEKYVYEEADKLYDHALKAGNGRNGLGSVFHWAEIAGVKTDKQLADTFRQYPRENKNPSNLQAPLTPTHAHTYAREDLPPAFPDYPWPPFIKQMIDCGNSIAQRDILLLGVFTVLGGTLNKRVRVLYGQKYMYPCLQTFIVAPPASGKGALTWVRRLAEPIHEEMMARYKDSLKNYREEKNRWDSLGKKRSETPEPEQPPLKMFLIAGDNSGTGILENLIEADGVGLICETEADTVSTAIGADHGHWSDTLRKCHDHERLAFNRRTNHEYRECDESYLSVLLSGTPAQVKPLIPSAENGLFSRQLFYFMPPIDEWMDQFDSEGEDYGLRFATWGTQWKQVLDLINGSVQTIQLRLSEKQKELFNQRFAQLFSHAGYAYGGSMRSAVARIAINTCRILSIVALLRETERAVQPTVRPVILPRRLRLWRFHAKRRGPYRHQYLPDPEHSSPVKSLGEIPPSPTKNFQFSIFHFQFPRSLPRPGDTHREYQGWYRPQAGPAGHRRGFPSRTHAHRASLPPFELRAGLPAYLRGRPCPDLS